MKQKYKVYINNNKQIVTDNLKKYFSDYILIEAAGGVVYNDVNQLLMIYRNGKWDLPKGKLEIDEDIKKCALREVEEECGVKDLVIIEKIKDTYHTYNLKGQKILKRTTWFLMQTNFKGELLPEIKENISKAIWVNSNQIDEKLINTYANISDIIKERFIS